MHKKLIYIFFVIYLILVRSALLSTLVGQGITRRRLARNTASARGRQTVKWPTEHQLKPSATVTTADTLYYSKGGGSGVPEGGKTPVEQSSMLQRTRDQTPGLHCPSRRLFLRGLAAVVPAAYVLAPMSKAMASTEIRSLRVQHLHTGEQLSAVYFARGKYIPESLAAIDHLLRDFRTDQEHPIERALLDLLFDVSLRIGHNVRFEVVSGYRSPATNAMLRRHSSRVAEHSLHTQGRAIDVRVQGLSAVLLRNAAVAMRRGGVGYYPKSDFVHLDIGRVRSW